MVLMSIFWYAYRLHRYKVCENSVDCIIICAYFEYFAFFKSTEFNSLVCIRFFKEANVELEVTWHSLTEVERLVIISVFSLLLNNFTCLVNNKGSSDTYR